MKKLWKWLARNVASFQALGALAVFGTAVVTIWFFWKSSTPDLLLSVQRNVSTIPVDLSEWSKDVADVLRYLPEKSANEPHFLDDLRPLAASDTAKRLPFLVPELGLDRFKLVVTNQANHTVSGTRLRVTGQVGRLWDVRAMS